MRFTYEEIRQLWEQIEREPDPGKVVELVHSLDEALERRAMLVRGTLDGEVAPPRQLKRRRRQLVTR